MVTGRPRTTSLPPEGMIKLGEEMIEWIENNNPLHLSEWYSIEKMIIYKDWKAMIQLPEFLPYYEKALKLVARNYLNGNVAPPIAQRFIRAYFKDVKEEEDEQAKYVSDLRKQEEGAKQSTYNIVVSHGLAAGSNVSTAPISDKGNTSS